MRVPPANPFKEAVEEPETEAVETSLPELPKLMTMTRPPEPDIPKAEESIKGNGHNTDADEQELKDRAEEARQRKEDQEAIDRERREAQEAKIPGNKFLLNVDERHLPETSRLNEREIFTFGVGDTQDEALNTNRTQSIYAIFRNSILRLKISLGGKGRDDFISLHQAEAEENARRGQIDGL